MKNAGHSSEALQSDFSGSPAGLRAGPDAFRRLARYDPAIAANFQLPVCIGQQIACWNRPEFVGADKATHMRAGDYVAGVVVGDHARAYPLWVCDHYHVINDRIGATPVVFVTCERCQSGAAFVSRLNGRPVRFASCGIYNATLLMRESGADPSLWVHYEGVAVSGPRAGAFLESLPTFHMSWAEWRTRYPGTDVMLPARDPVHRDARHGHGREEYFARPGMDRAFVQTIVGRIDDRCDENEPVLAFNLEAGARAYPLREIHRAGGVVSDDIGGEPVVVLAGPAPESVTMAAYSPRVEGRVLTLTRAGGAFRDAETGSRWDITGTALEGPLRGTRLRPLRWCYVRWHAWAHTHPGTEVFRSQAPLPLYPDSPGEVDLSPFREALETLAACSDKIEVEAPVLNLALPHEARRGLAVRLDQRPHLLFDFDSCTAAADYTALEGAWFCMPLGVHLQRRRCRQLGTVVVVSDPTVQYADPCNVVRLPDEQIEWGDPIERLATDDAGEITAADSFTALLSHLRADGFDIVEVAFLPHSQLRAGTRNAVAATINGNRFAIYKCDDETRAADLSDRFQATVAAGRFVFRASPIAMHEDPINEIGMRPDEEVRWLSRLKIEELRDSAAAFLQADGAD